MPGEPGYVDMLVSEAIPFTVNVAADPPEVAVAYAGERRLSSAAGTADFMKADNIQLLSYGMRLPWCFTVGSSNFTCELLWKQTNPVALTTAVTEVDGNLVFPEPDYEFELNAFCQWRNTAWTGDRCSLVVKTIAGNVSMVGVPTIFDTDTLYLYVFVKVRHTIQLS